MKLDATRIHPKGTTLYMFTMNKEEIRVLLDLVEKARINLPPLVELMQTKCRLRNLESVLREAYKQK